MAKFAHLHLHTQYSILDGASNIKKLMKAVLDNDMESVAITDHGNMYGVLEFHKEAMAAGVKPIIGVEAYVARRAMNLKESREDRSGHHLVLLAKNKIGYQNLIKMVSIAATDGFYYTPRIDKELLSKHAEGLIASSACLGGEIPNALMNGNDVKARAALQYYLDLFGDDFYLEMMTHMRPEQDDVNRKIKVLASEYGIKTIITNDVHFLRKDDFEAHKVLIRLSTGKDLDADDDGLHYTGQEYLKSPKQLAELFPDDLKSLENTAQLTEKIEEFKLKRDVILPVFPKPDEFKEDFDYLEHLTWEGAKRRYPNLSNEVKERIEFELSVIKKMGFAGYFLIVQDYINEARKMDVIVGPGRGSAAGSAVAYCIGITNIDPIQYNLLFERFLNPDRISMPDIDVDFDDYGRERVLQYVVEKYGKEKVAQIVTFGTMAARSAIRDVTKAYSREIGFQDNAYVAFSNSIAKLIPQELGITIEKSIQKVKELEDLYNNDSRVRKILDIAMVLEGNVRNTGTHACGVIISPEDISNFVPIATAKNTPLPVVQYEGSIVESAGMLKMDFLGLKTLSIIKDCLDNVYERHAKKINIDDIPIDDPKTYQLYQKGETVGTFQFESPGMRKYLKELNPTNINDLIAMNALYRPGPMGNIPVYIDRKNGKEEVEYMHPLLESILSSTYGIMIYQEQIMQISQKMAGFSKGKADELRKAMGKKIAEIIERLKAEFVEGSAANGVEKALAGKIYDIMAEFGKYGFNLSHSAAYSVVAYQTGYLKANYPAEYMAAVLAHNLENIDNIAIYTAECNRMGIEVLGADVNESNRSFTVVTDKQIRFGLGALKNVGMGAAEAIINERSKNGPYQSIADFFSRVDLKAVNKKTIEALASVGAFDCLNIHRAQFFANSSPGEPTQIDRLVTFGNSVQNSASSMQASLFDDSEEIVVPDIQLPECEPWDLITCLNRESEIAGFFLSGHPLDKHKVWVQYFCTMTIAELDQSMNDFVGQDVFIAGMVTDVAVRQTQNNKPFMVFSLGDYSGSKKFFLFKDDMQNFKDQLKNGDQVYIHAKVTPPYKEGASPDLKIQRVISLDNIGDILTDTIKVTLSVDLLDQSCYTELMDVLNNYSGKLAVEFVVFDKLSKRYYTLGNNELRISESAAVALTSSSSVIKVEFNNKLIKRNLQIKQNTVASDAQEEEFSIDTNID